MPCPYKSRTSTHQHLIMTFTKLNTIRNRLRRAKTLKRMAVLLKTEAYRLRLIASSPSYNIFWVRKRNGKKRWIEDPDEPLKTVQRSLNDYLQAAYFLRRTDAAFGFVQGIRRDPDPRNIRTNAERHLHTTHLLNADMQNFFHTVSAEAVYRIFTHPYFGFDEDLAEVLTGLCTHKGRLPMGAPTSPVLSNFAAIGLDEKLLDLAQWGGWTYTRFADDMSFSSPGEIPNQDIHKIRDIIEACGFLMNEEKLKRFGPDDTKTVTGLVLADRVRLPDDYLPLLYQEIDKLDKLLSVHYQLGKQEASWVKKYRQQVTGRANFATYILGDQDPETKKIFQKLNDAEQPPDDFLPASWLEFPY